MGGRLVYQSFPYPWVRSFSRPEKLPVIIHTGSSGTIYSYWVEKALLFANWSSFSRQMPSPYVSNFRRFSLNSGGGTLETKSSFVFCINLLTMTFKLKMNFLKVT